MELQFLESLQAIHFPLLDRIMIFVTQLGNHGFLWVLLAIVLCVLPKYRKIGITMALSLLFTLIIGNILLKNMVARPRPCWIVDSIEMLIPIPKDFSFPSGHTFASFAAAMSVFLYDKKNGYLLFVLASVIAFSRMYLFVHYPTDVLASVALGIGVAIVSHRIVSNISTRLYG